MKTRILIVGLMLSLSTGCASIDRRPAGLNDNPIKMLPDLTIHELKKRDLVLWAESLEIHDGNQNFQASCNLDSLRYNTVEGGRGYPGVSHQPHTRIDVETESARFVHPEQCAQMSGFDHMKLRSNKEDKNILELSVGAGDKLLNTKLFTASCQSQQLQEVSFWGPQKLQLTCNLMNGADGRMTFEILPNDDGD